MNKQIEHDGYIWNYSYTDEKGNIVYERVVETTPQAVVKTYFTEFNFESAQKNPYKVEKISNLTLDKSSGE